MEDISIAVSAQDASDSQTSAVNLQISGALRAGTTIKLGQFLSDFFSGAPATDDSLEVTQLQFAADTASQSGNFSAQIDNVWSFTVDTVAFEIVSLSLTATYTKTASTVQINGTIAVTTIVSLALTATYPASATTQGWLFSGQLTAGTTIPLGQLVDTYVAPTFGGKIDLKSIGLDTLAIDQLGMTIQTNDGSYTFAGRATWNIPLAGAPALTVQAGLALARAGTQPVTGTLSGLVEFEQFFQNLSVSVSYTFAPNSTTFDFRLHKDTKQFDALLQTLNGQTTLTVSLTNITVGDILDFLVALVDPGLQVTLDAPWSIFTSLSLDSLQLIINFTQPSVSVRYTHALDLGFMNLTAFTLTYVTEDDAPTVNIALTGSFLGQSYTDAAPLAWNALNDSPPSVPGQGSQLLDVCFLGLGQHVSFTTLPSGTLPDVLQAMGDAFKPVVPKPSNNVPPAMLTDNAPPAPPSTGTPLDQLEDLRFDASSQWLIGADLTLIDAVSIGLVFNDPVLYGLSVALKGAKVGLFDGLNFQILYKKVSDGLGEYFIELKLPDAMRHLEFGEVSITLPIVDITVFTNGNFLINFGFPYNNDFSQSFGLDIFPLIGAGGFYFGLLNGATSTQVPQISNGSFSPVIEFGIGLQVGVGKDIEAGVLSAGLSIDVQGILQGVFAVFNPNTTLQSSDHYYRVQGKIAIVGRLYGSVNFAVVKATLNIVIYATAQIVLESYAPVTIGFSVGVLVELTVRIAFINLHLHFHATISQQMTIGSPSTPPWIVTAPPAALPQSMLRAMLDATPTWQWSWSALPYWSTPQSVAVTCVPSVTAVAPNPNQVTPEAALLLFIENGIADDPNHPQLSATPFDVLCQSLFAWVIQAYRPASTSAQLQQQTIAPADLQVIAGYLSGVVQPDVLGTIFDLTLGEATALWNALQPHWLDPDGYIRKNAPPLSLDPLFAAYVPALTTLLQQWQQPFTYAELTTQLAANIQFAIQPQAPNPPAINASILPIFPELALHLPGQATPIVFNTALDDGLAYLANVDTYVTLLTGAAGDVPPVADQDANTSLATQIFKDYCFLILKAATQNALDLLGHYPHALQAGDTLSALATHYGLDDLTALASANQFTAAVLNSASGGATIVGAAHQLTGTDTLDSIASALSTSLQTIQASDIALACQYQVGIIAPGQTITIPSLTFSPPASATIGQLATQFGTQPQDVVVIFDPSGTTTYTADTIPAPLSVVSISNASYVVQNEPPNTVSAIATSLGLLPQAVLAANPAISESQTLAVGTTLIIPPFSYTVPPNDTASVATYFQVTSSAVSGSGPFTVTNATYVTQPQDTLYEIARRFALPLETLATTIHTQPLFVPGAQLSLPTFIHPISADDTLNGIAQRYSLSIAALATANATTATLLNTSGTLIIPGASLSVGDLLTALVETRSYNGSLAGFANVAGQVSRFLLQGIRLPTPDQTFPSPATSTSWAALNTAGLYSLIGQQFAVPTPLLANYAVTLSYAGQQPAWITLPSQATFSLSNDDQQFVSKVATTIGQLNFATPTALPLYTLVPRSFSFQHPILWRSLLTTLPFQQPSSSPLPAGGPVIWSFPDALEAQLNQLTLTQSLTLNLQTATPDPATAGSLTVTPVSDYNWATLIQFHVGQVPSPQGSGTLPNVYALGGVDDSSRQVLAALVDSLAQGTTPAPSLYLLYPAAPSTSSQPGLVSDMLAPDASTIQILKTNLATAQNDASSAAPPTVLFTLAHEAFAPNQTFGTGATVSGPGSYAGRNAWQIGLVPSYQPLTNNYAGINWTSSTNPHQLPDFPTTVNGDIKIRFWAIGAQGNEQIACGITVGDDSDTYKQVFTLSNTWACYELNLTEIGVPPDFAQNTSAPFWCKIDPVDTPSQSAVHVAIDSDIGIQYVEQPTDELRAAALSSAASFLSLLWKSSTVQGNGYYLAYKTAQQPNGLPDTLFDAMPTLTLSLLAMSSDVNAVYGFRNCVVTAVAFDPQATLLFAETTDVQDERLTVDPGQIGFTAAQPLPTPPTPTETVLINISAGGFAPSNWWGPAASSLSMNPKSFTDSAGLAIQAQVVNVAAMSANSYAGVTWQTTGSATIPEGATSLIFWAVGATGTETVKFAYWGDSNNAPPFFLSSTWQPYTISLGSYTSAQATATPFLFALTTTAPSQPFTFAIGNDAEHGIQFVQELPANYTLAMVEQLYHLLGYRIAANADFAATVEALPISPTTNTSSATPLLYTQTLPTPAPLAPTRTGQLSADLPDPYVAVGKTLQLAFTLHDLYGNQFTPSSLTALDLPIRYYDPLLPLTQWPHVAASYGITAGASAQQAVLTVYLDWTVSPYLPDAETSLATVLQRVIADRQKFAQVYYQISQPDVQITLGCSLGTVQAQPAAPLLPDFVTAIVAYLSTLATLIQEQQLAAVHYPVPTSGPAVGLETILAAYPIALTDLAEANQTLPGLITSGTSVNLPTYTTVQFHDSLETLAQKAQPTFQLTTEQIATLNQDLPNILQPNALVLIDQTHSTQVQPNETLRQIAQRTNTTVVQLATANAAATSLLQAGARLLLGATPHVTTADDTLASLSTASTAPVTVAEFAQANLTAPLQPGQTLTLPTLLDLSAAPLSNDPNFVTVTDAADTLSLLSTSAAQIPDLFLANMDRVDVLAPTKTVTLSGQTVTHTTQTNDTLRAVYATFAAAVPSLQPSDFAVGIAQQAIFQTGRALLAPPAPPALTATVALTIPTTIAPITAALTISRDQSLIDPTLSAAIRPAATTVTTPLVPHMTAAAPTQGLALTGFAKDLEQALDQQIKVMVGTSQDDQAPAAKAVFAVPLGSAIDYQMTDDQPWFFAPTPLANRLVARQQVSVQPYQRGTGLQTASMQSFAGVDLDSWGRTALAAIDQFLTAAYAVPAYEVAPDAFQAVLDAKRVLADALSQDVAPILQLPADPDSATRLAAAQTALRDQLLVTLSDAYNVGALVQYQTSVHSPYSDPATAPYLMGKPISATVTIDRQQPTLAALTAALEPSSKPFPVEYVAQVLANVAQIFDPQQQLTYNQTQYPLGSGDTLTTLAQRVGATLAQLTSEIASEAVLLGGKTLNMSWISYPTGANTSLLQVAEYLQIDPAELVQANQQAAGLIVQGQTLTNPTTDKTYVTQATDTFGTILQALGIDITLAPTQLAALLPSSILNNAQLLAAHQPIGALVLQPGFTLSSADLSLAQGSTYLTFAFDQLSTQSERVFLQLSYAINGLAYNPTAVGSLYGYADTSALAFVVPVQNLTIGQVGIPVPLRSYPTPPALVGQQAAYNATPATLADAKYWQYQYTYNQHNVAQDTINAVVNFNVRDDSPLLTLPPDPSAIQDTASSDLFVALAQFMAAYPDLALDLATLPNLLGGGAAPNAAVATTTFAQLVTQIAFAWSRWRELQATSQPQPADFSCRISEFIDDTQQLNILVERVAGTLPGAAPLPLIQADPAYWQLVSSPTPQPDSAVYLFTPISNGQLPPWQKRTIIIDQLDVLMTQNAWGGIALARNEDLLAGQTTNPAFVYQTPTIRFIDKFTPLSNVVAPLDIAAITSPSQPQSKPLAEHLSTLFSNLFALGLTATSNQRYSFTLTCECVYEVSAAAGLSVTVPVLLVPTTIFQIRDADLSNLWAAEPSFTEQFTTAIQQWQAAHAPNQQNGAYVFIITVFANVNDTPEAEKLLNFLVSTNTASFVDGRSRTAMPLSFYAPTSYWTTPPNAQDDWHTLDALTERLIVRYGADIYDVATMQIALSLYPQFYRGMVVAQQWTQRLLNGFSGSLTSIRGATVDNNSFLYGGSTHLSATNAFFFRSITDQYILVDPLTGAETYPDNVTMDGIPALHWTDWKPITGENAWATLLGPLQLAYAENGGSLPPSSSPAVQLALTVLPAYQAMRSPGGGIFYAPANTAGNEAGTFVDPYQLSNENNFSSYAGLLMLLTILQAAVAAENDSTKRGALAAQQQTVQQLAQGIQRYFQNSLYDATNKVFFTGGTYSDSSGKLTNTFTGGGPDFPFAVDVHTWGCTALGAAAVDTWFGTHAHPELTAYGLWQTVKQRAGYFQDGDPAKPLLGVGYSDVPNGDHQSVISAEWTFGAITMCRVLAAQYADSASPVYNTAYAASLTEDAASMTIGVRYLMLDASRDMQDLLAYYYTNRRYQIPFGWFGNRIDSLCSTSWALMVENAFNPFVLGGGYATPMLDPNNLPAASASQLTPIAPLSELDRLGVPTAQQQLLNFLVLNNTRNLTAPASMTATGMPLSYYVPSSYWSSLPTDEYPQPLTIDATTERLLTHYGLDIYDAATMQIALAIYPEWTAGIAVAHEQTLRLLSGFAIPRAAPTARNSIRGWTDLSQPPTQQFGYGLNHTPLYPIDRDDTSPGAFFFRAISDQNADRSNPDHPILLTDPLTNDTSWPNNAKVDGTADLHWTDWKPITGENAWAALIGPLQVAYSQYGGLPPIDCPAVQLALAVLPAYQAMVSANGGIFYSPWNTAGNQANTQADPLSISNENNFSSYAGLQMLQAVLQHAIDTATDATTLLSLTAYQQIVQDLISGIQRYFQAALYDATNKVFFTGGTYNNGSGQPTSSFQPGGATFPFAVDVHTWGCTVLGAAAVDTWFGTHAHPELTAYGLWQTVKQRAGYFQDGDPAKPLLGVGYSDVPNGDHQSVISAEWTFGAIMMCFVLAAQYADSTSPVHNATYAADLVNDAVSMQTGVQQLLLDPVALGANTAAYYYANRRYQIPFGWYANRIDSLCATSWAVMVAQRFNPFVLGGSLTGQVLASSASRASSPPVLQLTNLQLALSTITPQEGV